MEPTLFKIMIPQGECLENLLVLLGDNNCLTTSSHASVLDLPMMICQSFWIVSRMDGGRSSVVPWVCLQRYWR